MEKVSTEISNVGRLPLPHTYNLPDFIWGDNPAKLRHKHEHGTMQYNVISADITMLSYRRAG